MTHTLAYMLVIDCNDLS